jgi:gluconate 2-dehydrogenase gamma chain
MRDRNGIIRRRAFLGCGLAAAAGGTVISCARSRGGSSWRFFSAEEARTVEAICAQIIPADRDAGAREAKVVHYIDLQLTRHFKKHQSTYRRGIAGIDATSRKRFGKFFVELSSEQQVEVMQDAEENANTFFDLILAHTRQGFYGDPRHGGNRDLVSWKMLGLPFPQVRGRMHYDVQPKVR